MESEKNESGILFSNICNSRKIVKMVAIDWRQPFIVANVASKLENDPKTLDIYKIYSTRAINPFEIIDRRQHPLYAAAEGQLDIVKWLFPLLDSNFDSDLDSDFDLCTRKIMFSNALKNHHDDVTEWLVDNGCEVYDSVWQKWVDDGNFEYLIKYRKSIPKVSTNICSYAAHNGYFNSLVWLHENEYPWDKETCELAAFKGHIECLRYAHLHGCPWDEETCCHAVQRGYTGDKQSNIQCLVYAHENGCPWGERVCRYAAENGYIEYLEYAHVNGCPWDEGTCNAAAEGGHTECLIYAHRYGCPWDIETCLSAASQGEIDCLAYAMKRGCPVDESVCRYAALKGHLDCMVHLRKNGCPWDARTCSSATCGGHLACLTYARENGCPWDEELLQRVEQAIVNPYLTEDKIYKVMECFIYALSNGYNVTR